MINIAIRKQPLEFKPRFRKLDWSAYHQGNRYIWCYIFQWLWVDIGVDNCDY